MSLLSCRVDTVASYGQLFSTPSFGEHDPLFAEPDAPPDEQASQPEAAQQQRQQQQQQQQQHAARPQQSTNDARQSMPEGQDARSPLHITVSDPVKKVRLPAHGCSALQRALQHAAHFRMLFLCISGMV